MAGLRGEALAGFAEKALAGFAKKALAGSVQVVEVEVGGANYGTLFGAMNAVPASNRLWAQFVHQLQIVVATLLFAATGEGPYGRGAPDLLMVRAAEGKVRPVPRQLPPPLRRSLQAMLDPRPERRPSAATTRTILKYREPETSQVLPRIAGTRSTTLS